jgi:hypothetical protein
VAQFVEMALIIRKARPSNLAWGKAMSSYNPTSEIR